jgi:hypothetical protein
MIFNSAITFIKNNFSSFLSSNMQSIMVSFLPSTLSTNKIFILILSLVILKIQQKLNMLPNSFTINLYNIPTDLAPTPSKKLTLYLEIVKIIKKTCDLSSIPFIADYDGKLNYISNTSGVYITKYITLDSTLTYNVDLTFNCSITLSSKSISKLKKFINNANIKKS